MPGVSRTIGRVGQLEVSGLDFGVVRDWMGIEPELDVLCRGPASVEHSLDQVCIATVASID